LDYTRRVNARTSITVANRETVIAHRFWKSVAAVGKSWLESSRSNQRSGRSGHLRNGSRCPEAALLLLRAVITGERKHMKHEIHQHFARGLSHNIVRRALDLE
jgi:hypothetical protein